MNIQKLKERIELFTQNDCEPITGDLTGKILVLNPKLITSEFKPEFSNPQNQLWQATNGFGCLPNTLGKAIYSTCLIDNERAKWNREDFIGILKDNI